VAGANFLTYGTTERVANRLGAGRSAEAAEVGVQAMWLALFVAAVAVPALILGAEPLTSILGASDEVRGFAVQYLRIAALGVPFVLVALAAQGILRGASDYRTPLVILVASNVVNLVIELVLVIGLGYGLAAAAWSTVIAQAGAGIAFLVAIRSSLARSPRRRPDFDAMGPLLTAGRHLLLRVGAMLAVFTGATAIAARVDGPTLAAHQIAMTMFFFLALVLDALAVPAQTLVAEQLGNQGGDALQIADRVARLSIVVGAGLAAVVALTAPFLPHLFTSDGEVITRATGALLLLAALLLPGAIAFAYDGVLIGAADYRFLGLAALGYLAAVVPLAIVLVSSPSLGVGGIWTALLAWMVLRAVVNRLRVARVLVA
jgi:putative MATE family efflux protein